MIYIVVPTFNEVDNLPTLLDGLLALPEEYEVVVVDDASADGTAEIALTIGRERGRVHVLHRTGPRGYGAASKEGMRWALDRGCRIVATIDADLTHDPAVMPELVRAIDDGADVAIGSRYVPGGGVARGFPLQRRILSRAGNAYARLLMRAPARDNTSGYRCYRSELLAEVDPASIGSDGFFFVIESVVAMQSQGARIVEVPITYHIRATGTSSISLPLVAEALVRTTTMGLRARVGSSRPGPEDRRNPLGP